MRITLDVAVHVGCTGLLAVLRVLCCEKGACCSDMGVKTVFGARQGCVRGVLGRKTEAAVKTTTVSAFSSPMLLMRLQGFLCRRI